MENVISIEESLEMFGGDTEFMNEIIAIMREDIIKCLSILTKAYSENDTSGVRDVSHRIKGQAASIVAKPLFKISKTVENSGKAGYITKLEYLQLILALKDFIVHTTKYVSITLDR